MSPTLHRPNGAPGYSDQEVFAQHGAFLARVATFENHGQDSRIRPIDVSDTRSRKDGTGGNNLPLVVFAKTSHAPLVSFGFNRTTPDESAIAALHAEFTEPISASAGGSRAVIQGVDAFNQSTTGDASKTISSSASDYHHVPCVLLRHIVRRLTPGECETIQFFPQGWTRIPYRGKPADQCPDSPRYKAIGNSWATNCAEWILRRIVAAFRLGMI